MPDHLIIPGQIWSITWNLAVLDDTQSTSRVREGYAKTSRPFPGFLECKIQVQCQHDISLPLM